MSLTRRDLQLVTVAFKPRPSRPQWFENDSDWPRITVVKVQTKSTMWTFLASWIFLLLDRCFGVAGSLRQLAYGFGCGVRASDE
jgi:hypothetical protein